MAEDEKQAAMRPLNQCCCGLSLDAGIKIILTLHCVNTAFYIITTISNIVFEVPTFGANINFMTQTFNCGWALASIPFIAFGFSGVKFRHEVHLRLYCYWLMLSFLLDTVSFSVMLLRSVCQKLPEFLVEHGGSFACGAMRFTAIFFMVCHLSCWGYAIYVCWSRCEELELGGCDVSLEDLLGAARMREKNAMDMYGDGLFGTGARATVSHPVIYGSLATPAFAGSARIFGGKHHETDYPPKASKTRLGVPLDA